MIQLDELPSLNFRMPAGDRRGCSGAKMTKTKMLFAVLAAAGAIGATACAPTPTGPEGPWAAAGCYDSPVADAPDLSYNGVADSLGNLKATLQVPGFTLSTDGSCAGVPLTGEYALTLVRAADEDAAELRCVGLGLAAGAGQIISEYPGFPADAWVCNPEASA
jgi:hypothetical protein